MERWALGFDSWDITDQATTSLFDLTPYGWDKAREWAGRPEEFVKRGGFALMAGLAVHDKQAEDERFVALLDLIEREAGDPRNFVKKAVNWALRNIGKRNAALNAAAVASARRIRDAAAIAGTRAPGRRVGSRATRCANSRARRSGRGSACPRSPRRRPHELGRRRGRLQGRMVRRVARPGLGPRRLRV